MQHFVLHLYDTHRSRSQNVVLLCTEVSLHPTASYVTCRKRASLQQASMPLSSHRMLMLSSNCITEAQTLKQRTRCLLCIRFLLLFIAWNTPRLACIVYQDLQCTACILLQMQGFYLAKCWHVHGTSILNETVSCPSLPKASQSSHRKCLLPSCSPMSVLDSIAQTIPIREFLA